MRALVRYQTISLKCLKACLQNRVLILCFGQSQDDFTIKTQAYKNPAQKQKAVTKSVLWWCFVVFFSKVYLRAFLLFRLFKGVIFVGLVLASVSSLRRSSDVYMHIYFHS